MATDYDDLRNLLPELSPIATSGVDPDEVLASGDPQRFLAQRMGITQGAPQPAQTPTEISMLAQNGSPVGQPAAPAGSAAVQSQEPASISRLLPQTPQTQPITPATNAPNPASETNKTPFLPGTVTPTGAPTSAPTPTAAISNATSAFARPDPNATEAALVKAAAPQSATNPTGVPIVRDPNHPEYKPSVGRRIVRGLIAGGEGLAEGGLRGALLGALDPAKVGATPYGGGTRQFSQAAQRNAMLQDSLKQQLGQGATNAETSLKEAQAAGATLIPITQQMADANPSFQPFVGTSQPPSALKTIGAAAINTQGRQGVADTKADSAMAVQKDKDAAMQGLRDAQTEEAAAKADLARAGNDPNSPAYKLAAQRAKTASANTVAAQVRANAYAMNAYGSNLGTTPQGVPLPGSTLTTGNTPIGSKFQKQYTGHEAQVAQFNDVGGAIDNLEKAARSMSAKGQKLDNTLVAAALAQPEGTATEWVQGQVAKSNLTPDQRDYVVNLVSAHENLQAMRKAGGLPGSTEAQVNRLDKMLPDASTPDLDYFLRQIGQIKQTRDRLASGIPKVTGGTKVEPSNKPANAPSTTAPPRPSGVPPNAVWDAQGNSGKGSWKLPAQQ